MNTQRIEMIDDKGERYTVELDSWGNWSNSEARYHEANAIRLRNEYLRSSARKLGAAISRIAEKVFSAPGRTRNA